jgi:hypothetical protein
VRTAVDGRGRHLRRWMPDEIALLGKAPDADVARVLRRSKSSVQGTRVRLKILAFGYTPPRKWVRAEISLLGKMPDRDAAKLIGCSVSAATVKRKTLRIPYHNPIVRKWTPDEE